MQKIVMLTDSCCDLDKQTIEELGIKMLPFTLTVGGESFREIVDKSTQEFYELLKNTDEIPKHSQISPVTFEETYKQLYDEGVTDVICVLINSNGSGTYNNSVLAKEDFFEHNPDAKGKMNIYNMDGGVYTVGYGYPVMEAAKKIRKGAQVDEILAFLEDWLKVVAIYAVPYNLKYAKKSGRISAAKAFAGEMLGLKPIIEFADGGTDTVDKFRGEKNIVPKLVECVEKRITPQTPYIIVHGQDDTLAHEVEKELYKKFGRHAEMFASIGAVVTSNIGPDIVAVMIRRKSVK